VQSQIQNLNVFNGPVESSSDAGESTTSTIDVGNQRRSSASIVGISSVVDVSSNAGNVG
jgi:hypothetical protein